MQELSAWAIGNMLSSGSAQVADIVRACGIRSLLSQLLLVSVLSFLLRSFYIHINDLISFSRRSLMVWFDVPLTL